MALDPNEIYVAGFGHIFIAPVGTAFPADADVDIDADDWSELGYASEKGVKLEFPRTTKDIKSWQSTYPTRKVVTETPTKATAELQQWNAATWRAAMGGGTVEDLGAGAFQVTPPSASFIDEHALMIETVDGIKVYRFCFPKMSNESGVTFDAIRDTEAMLPITWAVLQPDEGIEPWFALSNDANLDDLVAASI
jgi:hypothetical protein